MNKWRFFEVLDRKEENLIHNTSLKILSEIGFFVDNEEILKKLQEFGGKVDYTKKRVYFSKKFVEKFINDSQKVNWDEIPPKVGAVVSMYCGVYLDPFDNEYKQINTENFLKYFKIAQNLKLPFGTVYAMQLPEVPDEFFLPYYHYLCFKFLGKPCSSINDKKWAELILNLCEIYSEEKNVSPKSLISAWPHVHFISPLKFTKEEAEIFLFFAKRNIKIGIGVMDVIGVTSPCTIVGSICLHLSQVIFRNIIYRAFFGDTNFAITSHISPIDMKTLLQSFGRPEKAITNIIMAQMARRYKVKFGPAAGHTDAKTPGPEATAQKTMSALSSLLASKISGISCGLLSIDEVYSPIQMVIDKEIVEMLNQFTKNRIVDKETIGFDLIKEVIEKNGDFISSEHTLRNFKNELWEPSIFSREVFAAWKSRGMKKEIDMAREICFQALNGEKILPKISEKTENKIIDCIYRFTGYRIRKVEPL
jgi:trimethylamine--corrinoid protein Co-methyltransferase